MGIKRICEDNSCDTDIISKNFNHLELILLNTAKARLWNIGSAFYRRTFKITHHTIVRSKLEFRMFGVYPPLNFIATAHIYIRSIFNCFNGNEDV